MYIIKKEYSELLEDYFTTEETAKRCVKEIEREAENNER